MKSKVYHLVSVVVMLAILTLATSLFSNPAAAGTGRIDTGAYNIACVILSQKMWLEDGVLYIRDRVLESVVISESEYHQGRGEIVGNANIDLSTGYGTFHGTLVIYPDAYPESYWAGSWTMQITENSRDGIARLKGYGPDLEGNMIKADLFYLPPDVLAGFSWACGGSPPISGSLSSGFVLIPGSK